MVVVVPGEREEGGKGRMRRRQVGAAEAADRLYWGSVPYTSQLNTASQPARPASQFSHPASHPAPASECNERKREFPKWWRVSSQCIYFFAYITPLLINPTVILHKSSYEISSHKKLGMIIAMGGH